MSSLVDRAYRRYEQLSAPRRAMLRTATWYVAALFASLVLAITGISSMHPEVAVCACIVGAASTASPRHWWTFPLVAAGAAAAGALGLSLSLSPVVGVASVTGLALGLQRRAESLQLTAHVALTVLGACAGVTLAVQIAGGEGLLTDATIGALPAAGAALGLFSETLFTAPPAVPSRRAIRSLAPAYRPPVERARVTYIALSTQAPDRETRAGLAEVVRWVLDLQQRLQSLDTQLQKLDPSVLQREIAQLTADCDDETRSQRAATARHLQGMLNNRSALERERRRTDAMTSYALAFLFEAHSGLALAAVTAAPSPRLDEVLGLLRSHSTEARARRETERELAVYQIDGREDLVCR